MTTPPDGFRHHTHIDIRFADMDAMGHVNNAVYLTYMETARLRYARDLMLWDGSPRVIAPILARVTVDYKLPLHLNDEAVDVFTRCSRLGNRSYEFEHLIQRTKDGVAEVVAVGQIVIVVYNYQIGQSVPIPDEWRQKMIEYEPGLRR